jgi:hypothetical protein
MLVGPRPSGTAARSRHLQVSAHSEASVYDSAKPRMPTLYPAYVRDGRKLTLLVTVVGISLPKSLSMHRSFYQIFQNKKKTL